MTSSGDARLDVPASRSARNYSRSENVRRVLWALVQPAFRWSPRPCFAWRRWLLRLFGARIGENVHVYPSTRVTMPWNLEMGAWSSLGEDVLVYDLGQVRVGARVTVSLRALLCAGSHDHRDPAFPLLKPEITIGDDAWICAGAFVGPGVSVGAGAVVAACAVAVRDVEPRAVVAGNPAVKVGTRQMEATPRTGAPTA